jgi:glycosyltransferase involved in cell wall biosynthesis
MSDLAPRISVVIPTRNRSRLLADTIASIRAVEFPPDDFEIVVVDDGSTDDTKQAVARFEDGKPPRVRYVAQPPRGLNAGRNTGIKNSRSELIVFIDDDVELPKNFLLAYFRAAAAYPDAAAFCGPVKPRIEGKKSPPKSCEGCGTLESLEAFDHGDTDSDVSKAIGANMAIRRSALDRIGLFNEDLAYRQGNESEWFSRLTKEGKTVKYVAAAWLWHRRPADEYRWWLVRKKFLKGRGYVKFARETGEHPPDAIESVRQTIRWTAHAFRRGCFIGFLTAAANAGNLVGWLQWGWRKHRAASATVPCPQGSTSQRF